MGIGSAIADAGDGRTHYVHDAEDDGAVLFGLLDGYQRIGGFTALRDGDNDIAFVDDGVPVPEFGSVFHLHRYAAKFFDDVFGQQRRVPAGATGHHDDALGFFEMFDVVLDAAHGDGARAGVETAAKTIVNGTGLLEDLFEHEMIVAAFFDGRQFNIELGYERSDLFIAQVLQDEFIGCNDGKLVIVYVYHILGVLQHGRSVGTEEMLSLADTDHERTSLAGRHNGIGMVGIQQEYHVGAGYPFKRYPNRFFQVALVVLPYVFNEVEQYLGIGIAGEFVSFVREFLLELSVVLDDAIVDHGQFAAGRYMGMGVAVAGFAVGGPAGMPDAAMGVQVFPENGLLQFRNPSFLLIYFEVVAVEQSHPCTIVTPVFEPFQAGDHDGISFFGASVSYDSAHK